MISIFDLFSIGIGPSSSHTVGPMRAAFSFVEQLLLNGNLRETKRLRVEVFGSLAHTGHGHGTEKALLMGLSGERPESVDPKHIESHCANIKDTNTLSLNNEHPIAFHLETDLCFNYDDLLPHHNNGMRFSAFDNNDQIIFSDDYFSVGGGFIVSSHDKLSDAHTGSIDVPYPFNTAAELSAHCLQQDKSISQIMFANELAERSEADIKDGILNIADVMFESIEAGMNTPGILPGDLKVKRRAPDLAATLNARGTQHLTHEHVDSIDWLNVYAIAVNEENAAGSRIVTAPTNGAAGIIPAVLKYYQTFYPDVADDKLIDFLLTGAAIAVLYKKGASISAAEVGCQGEVGVASSMAAAAMCQALGGDVLACMSAAEIAMEHNLGLTCDPIGGLVQVPCIERNAIGAVKAVNVARLALIEDVGHKKITLDKVIKTMLQTGRDMSHHYKETAKAGLANIKVNVVEC
jgi:L-serine dehydratase